MHTILLIAELVCLIVAGALIFVASYRILNRILRGPAKWTVLPTSVAVPDKEHAGVCLQLQQKRNGAYTSGAGGLPPQ